MTKRKAKVTPKAAKIGKRAAKGAKTGSDTKTKACLDLLARPNGATISEMQKVTGWQPHSVRGFISGTVKKKLGLNPSSTKEERGRVYRTTRAKSAA